jgi:hypothetical protein
MVKGLYEADDESVVEWDFLNFRISVADAVERLIALGIERTEAERMVREWSDDADDDDE